MHQVAGMIHRLRNRSMRSFAQGHHQGTILLRTQLSLEGQIRSKAVFVLRSSLVSQLQGLLRRYKRSWLSIESFFLTVRLLNGACAPCRDHLAGCAYLWRSIILTSGLVLLRLVYGCTTCVHKGLELI